MTAPGNERIRCRAQGVWCPRCGHDRHTSTGARAWCDQCGNSWQAGPAPACPQAPVVLAVDPDGGTSPVPMCAGHALAVVRRNGTRTIEPLPRSPTGSIRRVLGLAA